MGLMSLALLILSAGSLLALLARGSRLTSLTGAGSIISAGCLTSIASLQVLIGGQSLSLNLPWAVPGGEFALVVDPLAAFFILPDLPPGPGLCTLRCCLSEA